MAKTLIRVFHKQLCVNDVILEIEVINSRFGPLRRYIVERDIGKHDIRRDRLIRGGKLP
jgi:hypothetical protein